MNCYGHTTTELLFLIIFGIFETIQIILSVVGLSQTMQVHKKSRWPKILLGSTWIFYVTSIIFAIARILTSLFGCVAHDYRAIPFTLLNITYAFHWFALILILFGRLKKVFNRTIHELKTKTLYSFWIIF
eukprot:101757_1